MPIIQPSRSFEGSNVDSGGDSKYIRDDVPQLKVSTKENPEGIFTYFLPSYKQDSMGGGVWFHQFNIRTNFGTGNYKEKYHIAYGADDPAAYFERNYKMRYPDLAKVTEEVKEGQKFKIYPPYGSIAKRVATNNMNARKLEDGGQVLDLPSYNGFSSIVDYHNKPTRDGVPAPLVCDPSRCAEVFIKCKKSASGNPWVIQVDLSSAVAIPVQYQDSDYLINLEQIFIPHTKEELIEKLRSFFNGDVFDNCMQGYQGLTKGAVAGFTPAVQSLPAAAPVQAASAVGSFPAGFTPTKIAPAPAVTVAPAVPQAPALAPAAPVPTEVTQTFSNPMAGVKGAATLDAALTFLKSPVHAKA